MAQIGVRDLYYCKVTKDDATGVTYDTTPKRLAGLINININPTINNGTLFADDGPADTASSLGGIAVTFNTKDISTDDEAVLLGKTVDENGVAVDSKDDNPPDVAIGFRSLASDGSYLYVWLLKGKFQPYQEQFQTKDSNINFQTPSITGAFVTRANDGKWRYKVKSSDTSIPANLISSWFTKVYDGTVPA